MKLALLTAIILVNGRMINCMAGVNSFLRMALIIKELLKITLRKVKEGIFLIMVAYMKATCIITRQMEKGHILILFRTTTILDNGRMIDLMEKENKNLVTEAIMKDFLKMGLKMVLGTMSANRVFMKVNLKMETFQEKALLIILIIEFIRVRGRTDF